MQRKLKTKKKKIEYYIEKNIINYTGFHQSNWPGKNHGTNKNRGR